MDTVLDTEQETDTNCLAAQITMPKIEHNQEMPKRIQHLHKNMQLKIKTECVSKLQPSSNIQKINQEKETQYPK
mgnify:CR=1 FL=1